jgi:hypothetical protein
VQLKRRGFLGLILGVPAVPLAAALPQVPEVPKEAVAVSEDGLDEFGYPVTYTVVSMCSVAESCSWAPYDPETIPVLQRTTPVRTRRG